MAALMLGAVCCNSNAAKIWLEPAVQGLPVFGVAPLEMWLDASDVGGLLAGGLDLFYDETITTYDGDFTFDAAFDTDPAFSRTGDHCFLDITIDGCSVPGEINGIAFGNFNGIGAAGPTLVGTLTFRGADIPVLGTSFLTMADNDVPAGSWFDVNSNPVIVDYIGADITVVPLPAAAWLMIGGLGMLAGFSRKRKA